MIPGMALKGTADIERMLNIVPKHAAAALENALNQTARVIKLAEQKEMRRVFEDPVSYTINSIKIDIATPNNFVAKVWFKAPARMGDHYLVPQVEGGPRKLKGFERALDNEEYTPADGAEMTSHGNIKPGQIRQILSVLGRAQSAAGYSANKTTRSARRNNRERDYVRIESGNKQGLIPGVYRRVSTGAAISRKQRRKLTDKAKAYQVGWRGGVIGARGLTPILYEGDTGHYVNPLFEFYVVADRTYRKVFSNLFWSKLDRYLSTWTK